MASYISWLCAGFSLGCAFTCIILIIKKAQLEQELNKMYRIQSMCARTIANGICPHACEKCVWNWKLYQKETK